MFLAIVKVVLLFLLALGIYDLLTAALLGFSIGLESLASISNPAQGVYDGWDFSSGMLVMWLLSVVGLAIVGWFFWKPLFWVGAPFAILLFGFLGNVFWDSSDRTGSRLKMMEKI